MDASNCVSKQHLLSTYKRRLVEPTFSIHLHDQARHLMQHVVRRFRFGACWQHPFTRLLIVLLVSVTFQSVQSRPTDSVSPIDSNPPKTARWSFTCESASDGNVNALTEADQDALLQRIVQESERAHAHSNVAVQKFVRFSIFQM